MPDKRHPALQNISGQLASLTARNVKKQVGTSEQSSSSRYRGPCSWSVAFLSQKCMHACMWWHPSPHSSWTTVGLWQWVLLPRLLPQVRQLCFVTVGADSKGVLEDFMVCPLEEKVLHILGSQLTLLGSGVLTSWPIVNLVCYMSSFLPLLLIFSSWGIL